MNFDYFTGVLNPIDSPHMLRIYEGWTPYYTAGGRYVGCKCKDINDDVSYYNAHTGRYVDSYELLAWDCNEHIGTSRSFAITGIRKDNTGFILSGHYTCINCGVQVGDTRECTVLTRNFEEMYT